MVKSLPDSGKRSRNSYTAKDTEEIVRLVTSWTEAYNADDVPRQMGQLSQKHIIRQKWEREDEWVNNGLIRRFKKYFSKRGTASVNIVRISFEDNGLAEADIAVSFEKLPEANPFQKMRFVTDDDGVWRVETSF